MDTTQTISGTHTVKRSHPDENQYDSRKKAPKLNGMTVDLVQDVIKSAEDFESMQNKQLLKENQKLHEYASNLRLYLNEIREALVKSHAEVELCKFKADLYDSTKAEFEADKQLIEKGKKQAMTLQSTLEVYKGFEALTGMLLPVCTQCLNPIKNDVYRHRPLDQHTDGDESDSGDDSAPWCSATYHKNCLDELMCQPEAEAKCSQCDVQLRIKLGWFGSIFGSSKLTSEPVKDDDLSRKTSEYRKLHAQLREPALNS
ncbi:hypothetical protein M3P05_11885 [Sansalvadorimonas sp. 2012CJ34-2]|uniref:RING-type domain-containing protein n=1 Tax=Parendozoicomonas callyspongiae TaxID=2942213 RepID=A0ABT0PH26_9GAMM|nr:hypothetical protein [Sansalvadorimonas sp. 2012CJ34-2]MCL6270625.1 hypothetical protein [Sansalvadorimonas sp. 2012CJ34-2]